MQRDREIVREREGERERERQRTCLSCRRTAGKHTTTTTTTMGRP